MKQMLFGPVAGYYLRVCAERLSGCRYRGTFHVFAHRPEPTRDSNFVSLGETAWREANTTWALLEAMQLGVQEVQRIRQLLARQGSVTS
jgi:hypothetical protein